MERTRKTWGEKWNLFRNDLCEVSLLYLKPNRRCSYHKHQTKFNLFFVVTGKLFIKMHDGVEVGITEVLARQSFTTRPLEPHEFQTKKSPAIVIEIMYVKYDPKDIEREDQGGKLANR